jgi:RNA polymerase sigma-70 factor (ECF subfamily)
MAENDWLAERFEQHRVRLRGVAFRMLGSTAEAEDAVQEVWIRLNRTGAGAVDNLGGWLTTTVGRVALDMLRSRQSRREDPSGDVVDLAGATVDGRDPADEAVLAASVGAALLVVLESLAPAERLAFVLPDMFAVPFDDIGAILDRSPDAAKQLAHRARRKVQGTEPTTEADRAGQRRVVDAFLAASRNGEFDALVALLHPGVALRADAAAVRMGSAQAVTGADSVAAVFSGRARAATAALIDGAVGVIWAVQGRTKVAWDFTLQDGVVIAIDMIADPDHLAELEIVELP